VEAVSVGLSVLALFVSVVVAVRSERRAGRAERRAERAEVRAESAEVKAEQLRLAQLWTDLVKQVQRWLNVMRTPSGR